MWREAATIMIFILTIIILTNTLFIGLEQTVVNLNETGDYNSSYVDGNNSMLNMFGALLDGVFLAVFGILGWGIARVIRKELNRRGGGGRI